MELNYECMRDILLWIEKNIGFNNPEKTQKIINDLNGKYNTDEIKYCIETLQDEEFIKGDMQRYYGSNIPFIRLTSIIKMTGKGHDLLDNIRDQRIWTKTKRKASSIASSVSISVLTKIASDIIIGAI